jgi:hypothetical protein
VSDTRAFQQVQAHLRRLPQAPTTEEAVKNRSAGRSTGTAGRDVPRPTGRVEPPSSRFQTYNEGNLFQVSVPSNWRELSSNNTVTFAPDGAYGQGIFTHGIEIGLARNESHDLQDATDELLQSLAQSNPNLSRPSGYDRISIDGNRGLRTVVSNVSSSGDREAIQVYSTQLRNGNLFYAIAVAPANAFNSYRDVFDRVVSSIRLNR